MNKLTICKDTRQIGAKALASALTQLLNQNNPISEVLLRDVWLMELRKYQSVFPDGWYEPPPHGIGVLLGTDEDIERVSPKSLRIHDYWPREDIFLDRKKGIIFVYISPVDKNTGIIGDFGLTIYFGKNLNIRNHLTPWDERAEFCRPVWTWRA